MWSCPRAVRWLLLWVRWFKLAVAAAGCDRWSSSFIGADSTGGSHVMVWLHPLRESVALFFELVSSFSCCSSCLTVSVGCEDGQLDVGQDKVRLLGVSSWGLTGSLHLRLHCSSNVSASGLVRFTFMGKTQRKELVKGRFRALVCLVYFHLIRHAWQLHCALRYKVSLGSSCTTL